MRRSLGRLASSGTSRGNYAKQTLIGTSDFSTFSGGDGRGRGRGSSSPSNPIFPAQSIGRAESVEPNNAESDGGFASQSAGVGRGRGKPIVSTPIGSSLPKWIPVNSPSLGRGVTNRQTQQTPQESQPDQPKKPFFFRREESPESTQKPQFVDFVEDSDKGTVLPSTLMGGLPGIGRGKAVKFSGAEERPAEENRHMRRRPAGEGPRRGGGVEQGERDYRRRSPQRLSEEWGEGRGRGGRGGRGQVGRGRGGRGGRGSVGWQQRGEFQRGGRFEDADEGFASGLYVGDNADGEKLAQRVGARTMDKLVEAFEEMSGRILPSPMDEAYLDAVHTNNMIEYEPEYLVEFDNPDIDDKPPIPLRVALEKMKPFLMAYEGIKSQEEWEEIIEELMERVPQMKELMDSYCGPDKVTAKQQEVELERVAKTLPENVPSSVKRFTDRAVLSLKSNPGWGFDKKCQFMDKLVWEVSQQYT